MNYKSKYMGGGLTDILKDPIGYVKELVAPIPTRLNNISMDTLNKYGGESITSLVIARTPLSPIIDAGINALSLGTWNQLKEKYGYDKLFHLALIINNHIILEKNEVVNLEPLKASSTNTKTEFFNVPVYLGTLNIEQLVNNAYLRMGKDNFLDYKAFSNNCQDFCRGVLSASNLLSPEAEKFLYQDVSSLKNDLSGHVPKVVNGITKIGSFFSRLIGKGKKKVDYVNDIIRFERYILRNGFRFL